MEEEVAGFGLIAGLELGVRLPLMRSFWPGRMRSDVRPFADLIDATLVPCARAMPQRLSPLPTV